MEFDEKQEKQLKKIILDEVNRNGGILTTSLKTKLMKIISHKFQNIDVNHLVTAQTLSASQEEKMEKEFNISESNKEVNQDIIGGFIVKSESKLIDASLSGLITNLAQKLVA